MATTRAATARGDLRRTTILSAIAAHWFDTNHAPSLRDLCAIMDYTSLGSLQRHLARLEADGLITRRDGRYHSLRLTRKGTIHLRKKIDTENTSTLG